MGFSSITDLNSPGMLSEGFDRGDGGDGGWGGDGDGGGDGGGD